MDLIPTQATTLALAGVGFVPPVKLTARVKGPAPRTVVTARVAGPYVEESPGEVVVGLSFVELPGAKMPLARFTSWTDGCDEAYEHAEDLADMGTSVTFNRVQNGGGVVRLRSVPPGVETGDATLSDDDDGDDGDDGDAPKMTGVVLAMMPEGNDRVEYEDGDTAPVHQTLAYLGSVDDETMTDGAIEAVRQMAGMIAAQFAPFEANVAGMGVLGEHGDTIAITEADELQAAHDMCMSDPTIAGLYDAGKFATWISHITGKGRQVGDTIRFDRVAAFVGDDQIILELTGKEPGRVDGQPVTDSGAPAPDADGDFDRSFDPSFMADDAAIQFDIEELGNPWRDENGRFAEKGYRVIGIASDHATVETANGATIRLDDTGRHLQSDTGQFDVQEMLNAAADVHDRVDFDGTPTIEVVGGGKWAEIVGDPGATFVNRGDTILVNADQADVLNSQASTAFEVMPVGAEMTVARYGVTMAMSQQHLTNAGVAAKLKLLFSSSVGKGSVPEAARSSSRATYGHLFTEYVASRGTTSNPDAQNWAERFGWDKTIADNPVPKQPGATTSDGPVTSAPFPSLTPGGGPGPFPAQPGLSIQFGADDPSTGPVVVLRSDGGVTVLVDGVDVGDDIMDDGDADDADLTIGTAVEFGNIWRDEDGRFAEKGYRPSVSIGTSTVMALADGRDLTLNDPGGLLSAELVAETLNGAADAYDRVTIVGSPMRIEVVTNQDMALAIGQSNTPIVQVNAPSHLLREVDGEPVMFVNGEYKRIPLHHVGDRGGINMPVHREMSVARYRAMAAVAHQHFVENVTTAGNVKRWLLTREWRKAAGDIGMYRDPHQDVSVAAHKEPRTMYQEMFVEYVGTKGATENGMAQEWAERWGWDDTIDAVPTAVGLAIEQEPEDDGGEFDDVYDAPMVAIDDDGTEYLWPVDADEADLTIGTAVQFGNIWRDENGRFAPKGYAFSPGGTLVPDVGAGETFDPITADEARGDSRAVTAEEFQRLAVVGAGQLAEFAANASPIDALDENWDQIKDQAFADAQESWGGSTIDADTGEFLPDGADKYALTVKDAGFDTVFVSEDATRAEFDTAMDEAKERFRPVLERQSHYLGVFHDDDLNRIDFDPVTVVDNQGDVHTIGAASRAIGGAYNFADGNGYWPPHVSAESAAEVAAIEAKIGDGPAEAGLSGSMDGWTRTESSRGRASGGAKQSRQRAHLTPRRNPTTSPTTATTDLTAAGFATIEEFSNPWRDENGRFAPKGYQTSSSDGDQTAPKEGGEPSATGTAPASAGAPPSKDPPLGKGDAARDATGKVVASQRSIELGSEIYARATAAEPEITAKLAALVADPSAPDYVPDRIGGDQGEMYGFKARQKTEAKIQQKVERYIADGDADSYEKAAKEIKDAVRFTVHFDEENYGSATQKTVDGLRAEPGIAQVKVKNFYANPDPKNPYRGVHASVTRDDGLIFEVQFHTQRTQSVKETMTAKYTESRSLPDDSPVRATLEAEMKELSGPVIDNPPTGAVDVMSILTQRLAGLRDPNSDPASLP